MQKVFPYREGFNRVLSVVLALLYTYLTNFVSRVMLREANRDKSVPSVMLKKEKRK